MAPSIVIRPMRFPFSSVNQSAPSGPGLIQMGVLLALGRGYSVKTPSVVMRPILFPTHSVNQSARSGPVAILNGWLLAGGMTDSVKDCAGETPGRHKGTAAIQANGKLRVGWQARGYIDLLKGR